MRPLVLDAWGILAWLKGQPGAERMQEVFRQSDRGACTLSISIINLGEVFYGAARYRGMQFAQELITSLLSKVDTIPASDEMVLRAAALKAVHRLSYADAFAVVAALTEKAPLVTGDPELWALLPQLPSLRLEWIGAQ